MEGDEMSERDGLRKMADKALRAHVLVSSCLHTVDSAVDYELDVDDVVTVRMCMKMADENLLELAEMLADELMRV